MILCVTKKTPDFHRADEVEVLSKELFQHVYTQYPSASEGVYSVDKELQILTPTSYVMT